MKVRVLWFERSRGTACGGEAATYRERVSRRWAAEDVRLRPVGAGREGDPRKVLRAEAEAVRRRTPAGWRLVALDERGEELDSPGFAAWLRGMEERGVAGVVFVVGSDLGLDPELVAGADLRLALSRMTLPHRLAHLLLWEQLYRAVDILGGGGYHRSGLQ